MPVLIAHTISEATEILAENPDATILNGGTDLMVEVNFNHRHPSSVLLLRNVPQLREWSIDSSQQTITIGAGVPYAAMETGAIAAAVPALAQAARTVGSPQIRAAGTMGGNLGTCSPAGDTLPVLSALEATIHLSSQDGERIVPFGEFMVGPKKNSRLQHEIITAVTLPITGRRQGYSKVGVRNAMVISVASACFAVVDDTPRLAMGSVGPTILRAVKAEKFLTEATTNLNIISDEIAREFGQIASTEARPIDDHRSTAQYRAHAIKVLASRLAVRGTAS
ncbi:MAG: FAD binding domain-containing protein [Ilumatobacteraceae bacterium]|jgi:CO/xanthine dehydrogenase FAD-binding subunit|nr:FAD binding domain-containing protein [Ilumatobacteraceae bacterium]